MCMDILHANNGFVAMVNNQRRQWRLVTRMAWITLQKFLLFLVDCCYFSNDNHHDQRNCLYIHEKYIQLVLITFNYIELIANIHVIYVI